MKKFNINIIFSTIAIFISIAAIWLALSGPADRSNSFHTMTWETGAHNLQGVDWPLYFQNLKKKGVPLDTVLKAFEDAQNRQNQAANNPINFKNKMIMARQIYDGTFMKEN